MDKTRKIRLTNTLLAAGGGVVLSAEWVFAALLGHTFISPYGLIFSLGFFWFINFVFIGLVATGYSERFKDPSLSFAQMLWASSCCLISLVAIPRYSELVYLLLILIAIFGVFRLAPKSFNLYAVFVSFGLACVLAVQHELQLLAKMRIEFIAVWVVFSACFLILISLCQAVTTLQSRLKSKNQELREAISAKSNFLANMSHEIRTPMNGVLGMLELMERERLSENQTKYLDIAKSSGRTLVMLINDILDFSKIEAGSVVLEKYEFNIIAVTQTICNSFYFLAREKDLDFVIDIDPRIPKKVLGDEMRVRQILNNIIGNALKFTERGYVVVVLTLTDQNKDLLTLELSVKDTGIGIFDEVKDKVFESFSQADNSTTREYGGSGLGLAISRHLCILMGGDITLDSTQGEGSRFDATIKLGFAADISESDTVCADERVFIIDDQVYRQLALQKVLEHHGASVINFDSGKQGIADILSNILDAQATAVLVHASSEDRKGTDLALSLSRLPALTRVPVILIGPTATEMNQVENFLTEPWNEIALIDLLKNARQKTNSRKNVSVNDATHVEDVQSDKIESSIENSTETRGENPFVLLVEDDITNQQVATMLIEDCQLNVDVAENGQKAIAKMSDFPGRYRLVFMDCQMPVMDGYEATQKIREGAAGEQAAQIPIIAMTANALVGDREKCLAAGMNDYISKPVSFETIEEKVNNWIGR